MALTVAMIDGFIEDIGNGAQSYSRTGVTIQRGDLGKWMELRKDLLRYEARGGTTGRAWVSDFARSRGVSTDPDWE
jgi:hypothetical protein